MIDLEMRSERIAMDLDTEDVLPEYVMDTEQTDNMQQIVSAAAPDDDDDTWDARIDPRYMMLLDSFREDGDSFIRDNPLRCIRYEVDNGCYDNREFEPLTNNTQRRKEYPNSIRVNKRNVESKPPVQASTKKRTLRAAAACRRRESLVTENAKHNVETSSSDGEQVLDENYRSYLTWLVESSKTSTTNPQKEIQVKREEDTESLSDTEILAVGDRPFLDDEDSPFVSSKSYKIIDLEEECDGVGNQQSSSFRKEITNILKQPYNENEFLELNREASVHRWLSKCRQLRDGREILYDTTQTKPSYLDGYPDFKRMFSDSLLEEDRHRALNLLRGFIFYLEKVARVDAFKPWIDPECLNITYSGHKNSSSPGAIKSEFCSIPL